MQSFWADDSKQPDTLMRLLDSQLDTSVLQDTPVLQVDTTVLQRRLVCNPTLLDSSDSCSPTLPDSQVEAGTAAITTLQALCDGGGDSGDDSDGGGDSLHEDDSILNPPKRQRKSADIDR